MNTFFLDILILFILTVREYKREAVFIFEAQMWLTLQNITDLKIS